MLLPSDIARLVLGYMQQEGLCSTSQAFIRESPNLKEYAEHSSDDATIPACVFSLFGKNLTTILNEYVAVKAKETIEETQIPVMMTSLWKKLDFTLNQIKSMQNSPAIIQNQRLRTRNGIVNIRGRQRVLSSTQSPSSGFLSSSAPTSTQGIATPVCYSSQQTRPSPICSIQPQIQDGGRLLINVNRESPLQITVPDNRLTPGPLSPGRRKWRRGGGSSGSSGTGRANMAASSLTAEPQSEEAVTENFPQMLIQNARERILNDKSLQEKLAENINKILASDVSPQALKASCSTMEPDQSIDEILGLQGEIHMSNDVIQDILEQTESDPAFQALFDLFDYGKSRTSEDTEQGAGNVSNTTTENGETETRCIDGSPETEDPGTGPENSTCGQENRVTKSSQEPKSKKTRKSAPPVSSTSKATPGPSSRGLRRGAISTTPGPSSRGLRRGASSTTPGPSSRGLRKGAISTTPGPSSRGLRKGAISTTPGPSSRGLRKGAISTTPGPSSRGLRKGASSTTPGPSSRGLRKGASSTTPGPSSKRVRRGDIATRPSARIDQLTAAASSAAKDSDRVDSGSIFNPDISGVDIDEPLNTPPLDSIAPPDVFEPVRQESGTNRPASACNTPSSETRMVSAVKNIFSNENTVGADGRQVMDNQASLLNSSPSLSNSMPVLDQSNKAPIQASNLPHRNIAPPSSVGISQPLPQTIHSMAVPSTVTTTPAAATFIPNPTGKEVDPSKIVALKIIISDEQEEPSSDSALNQAVSSITGDRIPTIFLSSPSKSPAKAPALSGAPMAQEETVQAVSSLQRTEVLQPAETNPLSGKAGDVAALAGMSSVLTQPGYYIQLPFDSATSTNSYILVTDTTATDPQSNKGILPSGAPQVQSVPPTSYTLATPPRYSPGSRLIISSPVQPMLQSMVVPVSVVGQNNATQFSIVPNQLIAMPSPASAKPPAAVNTKPELAPKDTTVSGKTGASGLNMVTKQVHPQSSESTGQQKVAVGSSPSHRRMLRFDGSAGETSTSKAPATATPVSPVQQVEKEMPKSASAILGSSRPKRRIETVRCTDNTQTSWAGTETEKSSTVQKQKEPVKKTPSKRDADQNARGQSASTSRSQSAGSSRTDVSQSESRKRSQSADKKDDGGAGPKDAQSSRSSSSDHRLRSGSRKEKDACRQEPTEKSPAKEREGRTEKRTSSQDPPHVTANKENELEGGRREQQPTPAPRAFSPAPVGSQISVPLACSSKIPSKTSPLTKQAAEMLHDIQGLNLPSSPPKRPGIGCLELPLPRTPGRLQESLYCPRTPARQRLDRDGEGTPRHLVPPTTPDLPSCSPASEAGSENSINMAAHTLMILSRAAIARTGTPLKDSLRQEGAGTVTPVAFKSKKRKQPEPLASPPANKDISGSSGSKKKAKKQQKLMDSFPDDLDVDKFLSSLHYDE
ncbi:protein NPAT isoform X2 [Salmo salar]|uniref:Protein NPAT isoform X2 n=1 Tax=Salmo salar TaxID=8030 RepID=A0A1S3NSN7_SALSA|nr:protein NPAT isoform X2 [Salmo salar]|eukprot:XP_014018417.1 PREDICTED: protein NPAT isoform X2 [Salmo salar]